MKSLAPRTFVYAFGLVLLAAFLSACGGNTTTPAAKVETGPVIISTVPATAASTSAATPTPAANTGKNFQPFTGANFTVLYPTTWQKSHTSRPGGASGQTNRPTENIYGFVAQDNLTGFHVVRNSDEQAVGGMVNELFGGEFSCEPGDKSVPSQVTVGGVTWSQADIVCLVRSTNFEIRELVTSSPRYGQTVLMYGTYQQVGNGAVMPDFAHSKAAYFDPMLASFKFN